MAVCLVTKWSPQPLFPSQTRSAGCSMLCSSGRALCSGWGCWCKLCLFLTWLFCRDNCVKLNAQRRGYISIQLPWLLILKKLPKKGLESSSPCWEVSLPPPRRAQCRALCLHALPAPSSHPQHLCTVWCREGSLAAAAAGHERKPQAWPQWEPRRAEWVGTGTAVSSCSLCAQAALHLRTTSSTAPYGPHWPPTCYKRNQEGRWIWNYFYIKNKQKSPLF